MFRVCGSSKYGSARVLKGNRPWQELLVQAVGVPSFECLEIDESEPVSCAVHPSQLFYSSKGVWYAQRRGTSVSPTPNNCPLLEPVLKYINDKCGGDVHRHNTSMTPTGTMMVSTNSKQCAIAGRSHKSNNIWFAVDCVHRRVFQRCYDEECRGQRHELEVPLTAWSLWSGQWSEVLSTPKNKNTLYNMVD